MELITQSLSIFETTKAQRQHFTNKIVDDIKWGYVNPLKVLLQLRHVEELVKAVKENADFKELVLEEAQKHGKSYEFHNAKMEVKEMGVKYDYSKCGDSIWNDLNEQISALKSEIQAREAYLKNIPPSGVTVVDDFGEISTVYPPVKTSTTSIAVTLK